MLKTCIKYDLRAYRRYIILSSIVVMTAAIVSAVLLRFFAESFIMEDSSANSSLFRFISGISSIPAYFCILVLFIALVAPTFISLWRTYTHFFSDQGYLTFTLPVKRSTLYLSKLITYLTIQGIAIVEFILSGIILLLVVPPTDGARLINASGFVAICEDIVSIWNTLGAWLIVWVVLGIVFLAAMLVSGLGLYNLCLTVGCVIAKKNKIFAAIGIYYLFSMIFSFVIQIGSLFFMSGLISTITLAVFENRTGPAVAVLLVMATAIVAVVGISLHLTTLGQIERRLNLA